jgi:hypothetical protein
VRAPRRGIAEEEPLAKAIGEKEKGAEVYEEA